MGWQTSFQTPLRISSMCPPCGQLSGCPRGSAAPHRGCREGGAQEETGRLSTKPAPAKVEAKPKRAAGKDESSGGKVQTKGRREQREDRRKWPSKRLKIYLHQMETENKERLASGGEGKREVMCD